MNAGTTTMAATTHGFRATWGLAGESAAAVTSLRPAGLPSNRPVVIQARMVCKNFPASGPVGGLLK